MKNIKFVLPIILASILVTNAKAQVSSEDIIVEATVVAALSVTKSANVDFGTIQVGKQSNLPAGPQDGNGPSSNIGVETTHGIVLIEGEAGGGVTISWNEGIQLVDGSNNSMAYTPRVVHTDGSTAANTDVLATPAGSQIELDNDGDALLHIGGGLTAAPVAGGYQTAANAGLVITVQYD